MLKWFCHYLLTLMLFQTCMSFFLLLNTKEDILKNMGITKQLTVAIDLHTFFSHSMEVNGYRQLFGSIFFPYYGCQWLPSTVWFHIFFHTTEVKNCLVPKNDLYYGSQWLPSTVWFHIIFFFSFILWKSKATVNCLVPNTPPPPPPKLQRSMATINRFITHILQNIIFCVQQQKKRNSYRNIHIKFYRVNNERIFIFVWTLPLRMVRCLYLKTRTSFFAVVSEAVLCSDTFHSCFFNSGIDRNDVLLHQLQRARSERDSLIQVVSQSGSL